MIKTRMTPVHTPVLNIAPIASQLDNKTVKERSSAEKVTYFIL